MRRRWYECTIVAVMCLSLAMATVGCQGNSSGGSSAGGSAGSSAESGPRLDVQETFGQVAKWFPADTMVLAFLDNKDRVMSASSLVPPTSVTGLESGKPGTPKALADDLEKMMSQRFGLNPTKSEGIIAGGGMARQAVILLGDFDPSGDNVETQKVAGQQAYKVSTKNLSTSIQDVTNAVWATKLGGDPAGLALFRSKKALKNTLEAKPKSTLAKGNFRSTYDELVKASTADGQTSRLTLVSPLGELPQAALLQSQSPVPLPKGVALNLGSNVQVTATGKKKTLDELQSYVEKNLLKMMDDQISKSKDKMGKDDVAASDKLSAITAYHTMTAYRAQLDPKRSDGQLTYAMRLPFMDMGPIATVGMVSAMAIPAFQRYMKLSRMAGGGMGGGGMGGGSMGNGGMGAPPSGMGGSGSGGPSPEEMEKMREQLEKRRKELESEGLGQ